MDNINTRVILPCTHFLNFLTGLHQDTSIIAPESGFMLRSGLYLPSADGIGFLCIGAQGLQPLIGSKQLFCFETPGQCVPARAHHASASVFSAFSWFALRLKAMGSVAALC